MSIQFGSRQGWRRGHAVIGAICLGLWLAMAGCQSTDKKAAALNIPLDEALRIDAGEKNREAKRLPIASSKQAITDQPQEMHVESPGSNLPTKNLADRPPGLTDPRDDRPVYYDLATDMTLSQDNASEMVEFNILLDNAAIAELVAAMAEVLGFEYYLDPAVSGAVSFEFHSEMQRAQVWELLSRILWFNGAYLTRDEGFVRIMNMETMPREHRLFATEQPRVNAAVELVKFRNTLATDMAPLIAPYMSPKATITPVPHLNSLLIVDTPANMIKLQELVSRLDKMGESDWPQDSIPVHYIDPVVLAEELKQILPILGYKVTVGDTADNLSVRLVPLPRLQALIVTAPDAEVVREIRRWVHVLDRQDQGEQEQIYNYAAKHTKAEDLADALNFFFNSSSSRSRRSGGAADRDTSTSEPATARAGGGAAAATKDDAMIRVSVYEIPVSIFVDTRHNRLVIRTTPRAHGTMLALLESLDTPPYQVLIQMSIAEIQLNEETRMGFKYSAISKINSGKYDFLSRFAYGDDLTATSSTGLNLVLSKVDDPTRVFGFIEAVAGRGNTRVLFSPQVMAISDEEAVISVGDKVPIVTQENNPTEGNNITREIQYQDTGIIMTVTPHVTASRMVTLKIRQEVSDAVQTTTSKIDSPTIQNRVVETSLIVEDNSTILLGGLIRTRDIASNSGIPYLKDIPGVGRLFALNVQEKQRLELLILMTVNVIEMDADVERLAKRYRAAMEAIKRELYREQVQDVDTP